MKARIYFANSASDLIGAEPAAGNRNACLHGTFSGFCSLITASPRTSDWPCNPLPACPQFSRQVEIRHALMGGIGRSVGQGPANGFNQGEMLNQQMLQHAGEKHIA